MIELLVLAYFGLSLLYMLNFVTRVLEWDRYRHGYRIRPGVWNLIVMLRLVVCGWLLIADVNAVVLSVGETVVPVMLSLVLVGLFFLPTPLAIAYELRWLVETWYRRQEWEPSQIWRNLQD